MVKHSRRYREMAQLVDPEKLYTLEEAVELVGKIATTKFDETVELHLRVNSDPRNADQMIRGVTALPHGLGKEVRVLVFASGEATEIARQAGADYVGEDDLIKRIEDGWLEFDVGLAVPEVMGKIGRLGRILGRKGLMPNPRTGTLVQPRDLPRVIEEAKKGRLEFRMDRTAIIHCPVGKGNFEPQRLMENIATLVDAVMRIRPPSVKGSFISSAYLTTTMGPSVTLDLPSLLSLTVE
jgi:large subunit ribosomal protein L1